MKLQMFCTIDQTTATISKPLSSIQTFHTHTHAIKFVSFHLPQMQFNMFLLSVPRLKPSLRNPNPHGHLRKELLLYLPFQKKERPPKSRLACRDTIFRSNSSANSEHHAFTAAWQEKFFTPVAPKLCFARLHVTLVIHEGWIDTELLEGLTGIAETWKPRR